MIRFSKLMFLWKLIVIVSIGFFFLSPFVIYGMREQNETIYTYDGESDVTIPVKQTGEYLQLPFTIPEKGFYKLHTEYDTTDSFDVLIDGERYNDLHVSTVNKKPFEKTVLFNEGQHSLLFYLKNKGNFTLNSLSIIKDDRQKNFVDTTNKWISAGHGSKMLKVGDMYTGSYINVNIARDSAMFSKNDYQYLSYFNSEGFLVIARRKHGSDYFEKYWIPIKLEKHLQLSNPHNYISMQMDNEGYIHITYGQHNSRIRYVRSLVPYEIHAWSPETTFSPSTHNNSATYVSFFNTNEALFAMFRRGPHGFGEQVLLRYDQYEKKWTPLHVPFITAEGAASPYFWKPAVSPNGTIHLFWTWRLSVFGDDDNNPFLKNDFSGFTNKNIYYAKSVDNGNTWTTARNNNYTIPIKGDTEGLTSSEPVAEISVGEDFFNHFGADTDSIGRPYIVYTRTQDKIPQQWLTFWDGQNWITNQVTNYTEKIYWTRPQQEGRASTDVVRPSVLVGEDGTAIVFSRTKEKNNVPRIYVSEKNKYDKWNERIIFNGSVGGWEPQIDTEMWKEKGEINLLLLGVTDEAIAGDYPPPENLSAWENLKVTMQKNIDRIVMIVKIKLRNTLIDNIGYYSDDTSVEILPVDKRLEKNTGYILEVELR